MDELVAILSAVRFNFSSEAELQDGIESVLKDAGVVFQREYRLNAKERIDFYLPVSRHGIEVKTKGSPSSVLRQVHGYAQNDAIAGLLLVTSRLRLTLPDELNGKPMRVLSLWQHAL